MEVVITTLKHNQSTQLVFSVISEYNNSFKESHSYDIGGLAMVTFQFKKVPNELDASIAVRKHESMNNQAVLVTVKCLKNEYKFNCTDDWSSYNFMGRYRPIKSLGGVGFFVLNVCVTANIVNVPEFKALYDNKYTDFNLGTEECSVPVHKAVLAATSDVFKTMLMREWKETIRGSLEIEGLTQQTFVQFKKYMYYGELPEDDDLELLLLIGSCYMINQLVDASIDKLALTVTGDRLMNLLEFAINHRMMKLIYAMIQMTPAEVVQAAWDKKKRANLQKRLINLSL